GPLTHAADDVEVGGGGGEVRQRGLAVHADQPLVAAERDQVIVEGAVGLGETEHHARVQQPLHRVADVQQAGEVGCGDVALGDEVDGAHFNDGAGLPDLVDVALFEQGREVPAASPVGEQAFVGEQAHRFAKGGAV